jgi:hypothetical protein
MFDSDFLYFSLCFLLIIVIVHLLEKSTRL